MPDLLILGRGQHHLQEPGEARPQILRAGAGSGIGRATAIALARAGAHVLGCPLPGAAHYAATKASLEQLTRSWALELATDGIRVNALAPGPTESEALTAAGLPDGVVEQIKQDEAARIPLGRRGTPEEVAAWIVHLAGPAAAWITGQILTVDGGLELTSG
ncbi:SDR family oxidoreductase [Nonomuraea jabiensis]|uniref:SDR family NAD(P)-dependent oxidoreductase n=1 Tax=Nonomuraea jabiensis TaxID=882448 RepID=UPI003D7412CD